jgi:Transglutaminase-like superfamily
MRVAHRELRAAAAATLRAGLLEVALRTLPLSRIVATLGVSMASARGPSTNVGSVRLSPAERRRLRAIRRVMRRWRGRRGTCLRSALLAAHALRGRAPTVLVGVRYADAGIEAHAWVEVDGVALGFRSGYLPLHGSDPVAV